MSIIVIQEYLKTTIVFHLITFSKKEEERKSALILENEIKFKQSMCQMLSQNQTAYITYFQTYKP